MKRNVILRIVICSLILMAGITGMIALANLKKPPGEAKVEESAIPVEVKKAVPETITVDRKSTRLNSSHYS